MNQSKIWSKSLKASEGTINIMIPDKEANGYFFVGLTSPYQWKGLSSRQHQWSGRPSSTKSEVFFYIWWQWERLFCFIILKMQWERLFCFIIIKTQLLEVLWYVLLRPLLLLLLLCDQKSGWQYFAMKSDTGELLLSNISIIGWENYFAGLLLVDFFSTLLFFCCLYAF